MRKLILLDRDGVINKFPGYGNFVKSVEELYLQEGSAEAIAMLNSAGYEVFVISNQSGVGRGLYTEKDLQDITEKLKDMLKKQGAFINAFFYCIHRPDEACQCRKPSDYFVKEAINTLGGRDNIEGDIYMAGDSEKDIEMAYRAGIKSCLVLSGRVKIYREGPFYKPDVISRDLLSFVEFLLKGDK